MEFHTNVFILQLNLLASVILLTIAFVLFFRKNNAKPNIFLGIIMLYPATSILLNIIFIIFAKHRLLFLAPMSIGFNLTFGPVLLIYLHFIQGKTGKASGSNFIQFIPAMLVFLSSVYYMVIPAEAQRGELMKVLAGESPYINLINIFLLLHVFIYLYTAWKEARAYANRASDLEIPVTENSVKWQKSLIKMIAVINVVLLLGYSLPIIFTGKAHIYSDLILAPFSVLVIYTFMIYEGLSYHIIYNKPEYEAFATAAEPLQQFIAELESHEEPNGTQAPYKEEVIADGKSRLLALMGEQKIYTQTGLKLHDVAERLDISPALLSFIINKQLEMTFFELVNKYRVEEAKELLMRSDHSHYKIEHIGEISGFNSRASFFSVFKKQVGQTPLAYRAAYANGIVQTGQD